METEESSRVFDYYKKQYKIELLDEGKRTFFNESGTAHTIKDENNNIISFCTTDLSILSNMNEDQWKGLNNVSIFKFLNPFSLLNLNLLISKLPNLKVLIVESFDVPNEDIDKLLDVLNNSKIEYLDIRNSFISNQLDVEIPTYIIKLPKIVCLFYASNKAVPTFDLENCVLFFFNIGNLFNVINITAIPHNKNTCLISIGNYCIYKGFHFLNSLQLSYSASLTLPVIFPEGLTKLKHIIVTCHFITDGRFELLCKYIAQELIKVSNVLIIRLDLNGYYWYSFVQDFENKPKEEFMSEYCVLKWTNKHNPDSPSDFDPRSYRGTTPADIVAFRKVAIIEKKEGLEVIYILTYNDIITRIKTFLT